MTLEVLPYKDKDLLEDILLEYSRLYNGSGVSLAIERITPEDFIFVEIDEAYKIVSVALYGYVENGVHCDALTVKEKYIYKSKEALEDIIDYAESYLKNIGVEEIILSAAFDARIEAKKRLYRMKGYTPVDISFRKELK